MNETSLTDTLTSRLREAFPSFVIWKIADRFSHGIPDIEVNGLGVTSHWEVKYADPDFTSKGIQELTMLRLQHTLTPAFYIIFQKEGKTKSTHILTPDQFRKWPDVHVDRVEGFHFEHVVDKVAEVHRAVAV